MPAKEKLKFLEVEKVKAKVDSRQKTRIKNLYSDVSKEIGKQVNNLSKDVNISAVLKQKQLKVLKEQIDNELANVSNNLPSIYYDGMTTVSEAVVEAMQKELVNMGFTKSVAESAFLHVPAQAVQQVALGRIYEESWSLSTGIWGVDKRVHKQIEYIIAQGVQLGKSSYDIAKDLEIFVDPKAKKPWDWNKVYPGSGKTIDYNAQRLARTMVSHTYQLTNIMMQKYNPWVDEFEWRSAMIHGRTCQMCKDMDGNRYPKDEVPLDHPNGLCTIYAVKNKTSAEIDDDIVNWYAAPYGTYPLIDRYALSMEGKIT